MTGEITLRGRVLPIGGLKEKLLAAQQHGIKMALVPFENKNDVEEVIKETNLSIDIRYVKTMDEVLKLALKDSPFKKKKAKTKKTTVKKIK